ncbi:1-phosphatidylinositol 4,5-bisphosphate phosphodiesterase eta-2-like [Paramacrobiotus metropolitanus]|uniref:1-phosphatidylinositol 4,5-bisphosphate phosphodiesterase eta-2-like n=1 Tax=Paramacrobiotus metropolitanus TaxID=2943436 RepID=UPI002445C884|nr:1-phosphatidylinositol 4,5-bisphosphate phosphodiesterase eta-2-like [Paramacrobiotus metropolitanus]
MMLSQKKAAEAEEARRIQEKREFDKSASILLHGCSLWIISSNKRADSRTFYLSSDYEMIYYRDDGPYRYPLAKSKATIIDMSDIKDVCSGYRTDVFQSCAEDKKFAATYREDCCFSFLLTFGTTLDLVAENREICAAWTNIVQRLIKEDPSEIYENRLKKFLRKCFRLADTSGDGHLGFEECVKLVGYLNKQVSRETTLKFFMAAGATAIYTESPGVALLDRDGFHKFYRLLTDRKDLKDVFMKIAAFPVVEGLDELVKHGHKVWTLHHLRAFLKDSQKEQRCSNDECKKIVQMFEPGELLRLTDQLSFTGFQNYLLHQKQFLQKADSEWKGPGNNAPPIRILKLSITVISAQHLPKAEGKDWKSITDPYVQIKLLGDPRDCSKEQTDFVANNGFGPTWNKAFKFLLYEPEDAVIRFKLKDKASFGSDVFIAHCIIPVMSMKEGYRHIQLFDKQDNLLAMSTLFVLVEKEPIYYANGHVLLRD